MWENTSKHDGAAINQVQFAPDGMDFLSAGDDGTACLWLHSRLRNNWAGRYLAVSITPRVDAITWSRGNRSIVTAATRSTAGGGDAGDSDDTGAAPMRCAVRMFNDKTGALRRTVFDGPLSHQSPVKMHIAECGNCHWAVVVCSNDVLALSLDEPYAVVRWRLDGGDRSDATAIRCSSILSAGALAASPTLLIGEASGSLSLVGLQTPQADVDAAGVAAAATARYRDTPSEQFLHTDYWPVRACGDLLIDARVGSLLHEPALLPLLVDARGVPYRRDRQQRVRGRVASQLDDTVLCNEAQQHFFNRHELYDDGRQDKSSMLSSVDRSASEWPVALPSSSCDAFLEAAPSVDDLAGAVDAAESLAIVDSIGRPTRGRLETIVALHRQRYCDERQLLPINCRPASPSTSMPAVVAESGSQSNVIVAASGAEDDPMSRTPEPASDAIPFAGETAAVAIGSAANISHVSAAAGEVSSYRSDVCMDAETTERSTSEMVGAVNTVAKSLANSNLAETDVYVSVLNCGCKVKFVIVCAVRHGRRDFSPDWTYWTVTVQR